MSALFITFEGIEGAGKSTIISKVSRWFANQNIQHICSREPGGTKGSEAIRNILLETDFPLCPEAELFLIQAARAQLMQEIIIPALMNNTTVLLDRHTDSTLAYQGYGRGLSIDTIHQLNVIATNNHKPDLTIILDLDHQTGLERVYKINPNPDRFESETLDFMEKVRKGFLTLSQEDPKRKKIISAEQSIDEVYQNVLTSIQECLKKN